jgi:hypothetical protein
VRLIAFVLTLPIAGHARPVPVRAERRDDRPGAKMIPGFTVDGF